MMPERSTTAVHATAVLLGCLLAVWWSRSLPWTPSRIFGAALMLPAVALWLLARVQLGRSFAVRAQAKELVTHGLYSKIRNPVYVFGSIFIAAMCLFLGKPAGLLLLLVLIPIQIVRARKESKVLEAKFGDAYREYRRKTWV